MYIIVSNVFVFHRTTNHTHFLGKCKHNKRLNKYILVLAVFRGLSVGLVQIAFTESTSGNSQMINSVELLQQIYDSAATCWIQPVIHLVVGESLEAVQTPSLKNFNV